MLEFIFRYKVLNFFKNNMISIYEYIDYREYLNDWFDAKKSENKRFSHRMFSRLMDQKSPSFLKDIVHGRRNLTQEQQERCYKVLKLNAEERRYFNDMVLLDHSDDPNERDRSFERIAAARRLNGARKIEGESYRYLSRWYCPAIRELGQRPDFKATPEWVIEHLRPKISKKEAKEALQILKDLEILTVNNDGSHEFSEGSITTPMQVSGLAVHNYHQEMLKLAREGVSRFEPEDRHYIAVTVSIPESIIPKLKSELNDMAARLLDLCDSARGEAEKACQIHLHFFPLSDTHKENGK